MKVELNEKFEKLFALMEESEEIKLKKFVYDIKSFNAFNKIRSRTSVAYPSRKTVYDFKEFSCEYASVVKINSKEDNSFEVHYTETVNNKKMRSSVLYVEGNVCKLVNTIGKEKETITFKYNSKRVLQVKDDSKTVAKVERYR